MKNFERGGLWGPKILYAEFLRMLSLHLNSQRKHMNKQGNPCSLLPRKSKYPRKGLSGPGGSRHSSEQNPKDVNFENSNYCLILVREFLSFRRQTLELWNSCFELFVPAPENSSLPGQKSDFCLLTIQKPGNHPKLRKKRSRSEKAIPGGLGEFWGILGAALGIQNSTLGIRNSILGVASHDLRQNSRGVVHARKVMAISC